MRSSHSQGPSVAFELHGVENDPYGRMKEGYIAPHLPLTC